MKKYTALVLALCLALTLCLSACGSTEIRSYSDDEAAKARDLSGAYAAYDPDTVVMTVNGDKITWHEYFYWLNSIVLSLDSENGSQITDWSADSGKGDGQTFAQYAAAQVKQAILQYHVINAKAAELGVALTDDDKTELASTLKTNMAKYCGDNATEADFDKYLQSMYMDREYYDYINGVIMLYYDIFDETMGKNGEKCSDEETDNFAKDNAYITADHILLSTVDSEGAALAADKIAEKQKQAQEIADELQGITDHTALLKKFKELKAKYTEDTGAASYPNGYCFTDGQMVDEFRTGAEGLKEYQASDPVKSDYGYHVILRLPTTPDDVVSVTSDGTTRTLRYYAAVDRYNTLVGSWLQAADVKWEGSFETLDIGALLKK